MNRRVVDYDQFRQESVPDDDDAPIFRIGGKEYRMAPSLPASLAIDVMAAQGNMDDDASIPPRLVARVGQAVFGPSVWREILDENQVPMNELGTLVLKVLEVYAETNEEDPEDPSPAST